MTKVLDFSAWALRTTLLAASVVMLASLGYQVFTRYLLGRAAAWSEEVAVLMFAWLILGGLSLGIREGYHVSITALPAMVGGWQKRLWIFSINAVTFLIGAYLFWSGVRFYNFTTGSVSAAMGYPVEILNSMVPVSAFLICIYSAENCFYALNGSQREAPSSEGTK